MNKRMGNKLRENGTMLTLKTKTAQVISYAYRAILVRH